MKKILFSFCTLISIHSIAQTPEDALRLSWFAPNGTPRSNALAGAMGALGGDLSATNINPAGLGFYKKGEFYIAPQLVSTSNQFNYFGNKTTIQNSKQGLGNIGMVFAENQRRNKYKSTIFSISYTKIADYNNSYSFKGSNNYSSYLEKFADQLYYDEASISAAQQNYIYGSSLAYHAALVNPVFNSNHDVTDYRAFVNGNVNQYYDAKTTGGYNEMNFSWAGNVEDKLYVGASIVLPMINYTKTLSYTEASATNNAGIFDFVEASSSKGFGLGAKLGLIYKPEAFLRFGLSIHTPQMISFSDGLSASIYDYASNTEISSQDLKNTYYDNYYPSHYNYNVATPLRAILSGSYFFASPSKPTEPLGFISADLEYVNYAGTKYYSLDNDQSVINYYSDLNATIRNNYKNAVNLKIGSEIKLHPSWLLRGGLAYYGSPYKDASIKANHLVLSGGIGYRIGNHLFDISLLSINSKDALFPYRLMDKDNYYAEQKSNKLIFSIGYGIKFN